MLTDESFYRWPHTRFIVILSHRNRQKEEDFLARNIIDWRLSFILVWFSYILFSFIFFVCQYFSAWILKLEIKIIFQFSHSLLFVFLNFKEKKNYFCYRFVTCFSFYWSCIRINGTLPQTQNILQAFTLNICSRDLTTNRWVFAWEIIFFRSIRASRRPCILSFTFSIWIKLFSLVTLIIFVLFVWVFFTHSLIYQWNWQNKHPKHTQKTFALEFLFSFILRHYNHSLVALKGPRKEMSARQRGQENGWERKRAHKRVIFS